MKRRSQKSHALWLLLVLAGTGALAAALAGSKPQAVRYEKLRVNDVPLEMIRADLARARVQVGMAQGKLEGFRSIIKRTRPTAAINGMFFHPNGQPTGDLVIDGKLVNTGVHRTGLCIAWNGTASVRARAQGAAHNWQGFRMVMCAGPRLVRGGQIALDPVSEGFHVRANMLQAARTAVGVTRDNQLLLVVTRREITLRTLAEVMRKLGAAEAVNFDGGGSTALYYRGKVYNEPANRLANVLLVYE